jgi:hypothetical protein
MNFQTLAALAPILIFSASAANASCYGLLDTDHIDVKKSTESLLSGNYQEFVGVANKLIAADIEQYKSIVDPLARYFPDGFERCRVLGRKDHSKIMSSYMFEFSNFNSSIYFYEVTLRSEDGFRGGIIQIQISTDFAEIFNYWK